VFVCENNGLSEFTVSSTVTAGELADRARAFRIPTAVVDGNDVLAVAAATEQALDHARAGKGPAFIEAKTYRIRGHLEAEQFMLGGGTYRTEKEVEVWRAPDRDPISRFHSFLAARAGCSEDELAAIEAAAASAVERAVEFADAGELADTGLVFDLMFVPRR